MIARLGEVTRYPCRAMVAIASAGEYSAVWLAASPEERVSVVIIAKGSISPEDGFRVVEAVTCTVSCRA